MADQNLLNQNAAKGDPLCCPVFSGVWFCFTDDPGSIDPEAYKRQEETFVIHYCHTGRLRINGAGGSRVLTGGDVWFVPKRLDAGDICRLSKRYTGLSLILAPDLARGAVKAFSADCLGVELDVDRLAAGLRADGGNVIHGANELSQTFSQIALAQRPYREGFLRLKAVELLLYLNAGKPQRAKKAYLERDQIERIQEIRKYLTDHLDQRVTQAELAKRFHISLTALKRGFQSICGMPLDTYLRRERIAAAKQLLRETSFPVSEIARRVGYESHSQFTAVFRASEGASPSEYRRMVQNAGCWKNKNGFK